jgi:hypothetical protein
MWVLWILLGIVVGMGIGVGGMWYWNCPPLPTEVVDLREPETSLPPPYLIRAQALTAEIEGMPVSGEFKRHTVYAKLIKEFPGEPRRVLSHAIEHALEE